jgi:two-component system, sensor histidine kinase PdtaS
MSFLRLPSSVGGRIVSLVAIIVVPIAVVCVLLAAANYNAMIARVQDAQTQAAAEFAVRTRLWFRSTLRTAETLISTSPTVRDPVTCDSFVDGVLRSSTTHVGVFLAIDGQPPCIAINGTAVSRDMVLALDERLRGGGSLSSWAQPLPGRFRYDIIDTPDGYVTAAHLGGVAQFPDRRALVLSQGRVLDNVFDLGLLSKDAIVGLVRLPGDIFAARGASDHDRSWLPETWPAGSEPAFWRTRQRDGTEGTFSRYLVIEPDIFAVTRFSMDRQREAQLSLAILAGAPLILLALLLVTFWSFVSRSVVQPIDRIEKAALAEAAGDRAARVDVSADMPTDVMRVAEAFNRMADAAHSREADLRGSLAANQSLMRELHHRVKNSLQVIQSHLAISRRRGEKPSAYSLSEAEARVQVLSIAYRYGLTERGLQQVPLRQYLGELVGYLAEAAARQNQRVIGSFEVAGALDIDRAIPLGLSIVEVAFACLRAKDCRTVQVLALEPSRLATELVVTMDGDTRSLNLSERVLRGLRQQLGALADQPFPGEQLRWTISLPERPQTGLSNDIAAAEKPT